MVQVRELTARRLTQEGVQGFARAGEAGEAEVACELVDYFEQ